MIHMILLKGFFWAHMGWLMFKLKPEPPLDNVSDLRKDKLVMWQYKWVHLISFVVSFGVPALIGYLYAVSTGNLSPQAGALGGLLIPGVARVVMVQHATFCINSLCHMIGQRPYSTSHSARDSWIAAIFTMGEGYHNYHHEFQWDYRNGGKALAIGSFQMDHLDPVQTGPHQRFKACTKRTHPFGRDQGNQATSE